MASDAGLGSDCRRPAAAGVDGVCVTRDGTALDPVCAAWDRQASMGIALLVPQTGTLDEAHLDYALYQLRRARKNCRVGWYEAARQGYLALQSAYPFPDHAERASR